MRYIKGLTILLISQIVAKSDEISSEAQTGIIELPVNNINFKPGEYNEYVGIQNVVLKEKCLHLRTGRQDESLIRWDIKNETENWAFEVVFNNINLNNEEHAELFISYTEDKPLTGTFRGGNGTYDGMRIGLSLYGKSVSIVYAPNEGKDYSGNIGDLHIKRDHIDPQRFRGVENFRLKLISTNKNLKMEVYDADRNNLLYDNFRRYDSENTKYSKPGKYFGVIAHYKNLASGKSFELKKINLYKRTENEEYKMNKKNSVMIPMGYREIKEINHDDSTIKKLIHELELSMVYIKSILGTLPETRLLVFEKSIKKAVDFSNEKIRKINEKLVKKRKIKSTIINFNDFEVKIQKIQRNLSDLIYYANNEEKKSKLFYVKDIFFGLGCIIMYVIVASSVQRLKECQSK